MLIQRAYKTELDPNQTQLKALRNHCGAARFIYNWALATKKEEYEQSGKSSNSFALNKKLTILKQTDRPWLYETCNQALQNAIRDLCKAYDNFFRRVKNGEKPGFPRFKSKYDDKKSFRVDRGIRVLEDRIQLPVIRTVRLKEKGYLPLDGIRIFSATVSSTGGRWFVSLQVEQEIDDRVAAGPVIGVDHGIKSLAVCSNGHVVENPRALAAAERKLKRLQKSLSRKQKGSANRLKAKQKVATQHYKIACVRKTALHQASSDIVYGHDPKVLVVEDLNVRGMMKNRHLAKALADASMAELKRQLTYKVAWNGGELLTADRFYPSSKTCSACGAVKETLSLSERMYKCEVCGHEMDRDLNAAKNLAAYAAG